MFRDGTGNNAYRVMRILSLAYGVKCDATEITSHFVGVLCGATFYMGLKAQKAVMQWVSHSP
jgi:hypothetical protein